MFRSVLPKMRWWKAKRSTLSVILAAGSCWRKCSYRDWIALTLATCLDTSLAVRSLLVALHFPCPGTKCTLNLTFDASGDESMVQVSYLQVRHPVLTLVLPFLAIVDYSGGVTKTNCLIRSRGTHMSVFGQ